MQFFGQDVSSECDRPTMRVPPPCPAWNVFVIDPSSQLVTHWPEGEVAAHVVVDMPLSEEQLESAARLTSEMPNVDPDIEADAVNVSKEKTLERGYSMAFELGGYPGNHNVPGGAFGE